VATKTDVAQAGDGMDGAGCIALAWLAGAAGSLCFVGPALAWRVKNGVLLFWREQNGREEEPHNTQQHHDVPARPCAM
jgi:hypothetical protein